eukprot:scaffold77816_cov63-Phaeocystis_antarctica.AAC.2
MSLSKCHPEAAFAKGNPAHSALLALLWSAALVLGARPCVGTAVVWLVSDPPPQPLSAEKASVNEEPGAAAGRWAGSQPGEGGGLLVQTSLGRSARDARQWRAQRLHCRAGLGDDPPGQQKPHARLWLGLGVEEAQDWVSP